MTTAVTMSGTVGPELTAAGRARRVCFCCCWRLKSARFYVSKTLLIISILFCHPIISQPPSADRYKQ